MVTERRSDGQTDRQTDAASPPLLLPVGRALPSQVDEFANALPLKASVCCLLFVPGRRRLSVFRFFLLLPSQAYIFSRVPLCHRILSASLLHLSYSRVCLDATHRATHPAVVTVTVAASPPPLGIIYIHQCVSCARGAHRRETRLHEKDFRLVAPLTTPSTTEVSTNTTTPSALAEFPRFFIGVLPGRARPVLHTLFPRVCTVHAAAHRSLPFDTSLFFFCYSSTRSRVSIRFARSILPSLLSRGSCQKVSARSGSISYASSGISCVYTPAPF